MPPNNTETVETKVAILQNDMKQMSGLFQRLDDAIEKMSEVSNCINKLLAVHEVQLAQAATDTGELFNLVETRRVEQDAMEKELHSRITTQSREIKEELRDDYKRLVDSIGELKIMLGTAVKDADAQRHATDERIKQIERKQWLIMGGALAGGFILGNLIDLLAVFA